MDLLLEAMWKGTKSLTSRSKAGQMPRVLFRVVYKEKDYHIGELDKYISLRKNDEKVRDEELRDIKEVRVDITELLNKLSVHQEKVERVEYAVDSRVALVRDGKAFNVSKDTGGIQFIALPFND